ncbi:tRNA (N(6)-L-threonylcarbamoyladenosine(37)-C(2))-methylthiotransferase MtaB [Ancylomarina euxinus]|uniref:Threonylcarbamoyladenosine tRNA methylthiotransferase MtaB n=1 Tax=Ancylomarina euxinus TaxID=2283627 RepID=A0A425Y2B1_9BACT|nr:tRNA (N(6)-L-threonylcarbamoyladenosine(37)-C(2))-methylthiotransferase MtaB [Ancylomarina euxinus]MCZ4694861.1 tRNA (N(6)-L-threonylcarbamoyladenosine(37)-C(2))-methylthiotransferase MtaB [Ancylomarina euxinus]MUP14727.1 tRNA (N(6)-L-threonylcarbamoyladenosine(37)-C(2))-methylthiotransferase MtaB [Ancylomarina euxinus]RRG22077.1 tRNA (N(6)-L-threonylcarbamoyladenosine(37)-C(2))-methylthiotransferase MtaB [Ancylomarina euxinus]
MKTIAFKTLGCRLNQYETDALASTFQNNDYKLVDFDTEADIYVINSCTVTHQSDHKSRHFISQANRRNKDSVLVVTGCMANNAKEELENRDEINYVLENDNKSALFSLVEAHFKGELKHPSQLDKDLFAYGATEKGFHTRSMIKIQDGCDNFCTFCIIPSVRGRAKSRSFEAILDNVRSVVDNGAKEVVITGVNIGRYEFEHYKFDDLIEAILNLDGDFRLRISSLEPDGFGDKFLGLLSHPKMTPHLHLCLQSGSDEVLLRMRRMYNIKTFKNTVEKVRTIRPDFNFTTDIIIGFPDESETAFTDSCDMIKDMEFGHVHAFKYSIRKGTRAERMENQVPEKVKTERSEVLRGIAEESKLKYRSQFIGQTQRVLVETINGNTAKGYGEHYIPVQFEAEDLKENTFYNVSIKAIVEEKDGLLLGELI